MNRKHICALLGALIMMSGCGSADKPEESSQPASDASVPAEKAQSVIWVKEPSMKLDCIYELESVPFILEAQPEYTGNPAGWHLADADEGQYGDVPDYREDAVAASYEGGYGVIDYEGNVLFPFIVKQADSYSQDDPKPIRYQPYTGFINWYSDGSAKIFSSGFTSRSYCRTGGLGGWAPQPYVCDHEILVVDPQTNTAMAFENPLNRRIIATVRDENGRACGGAVIDENTEIVSEFEGIPDLYVNGFVRVRESEQYDDMGKFGFVKADGGISVTGGPVYEDAKYFTEGYAPVKRDGLWTFIDEQGREIFEPLFTDVSSVNNGRAFVCVDGLYGILDLKQTLTAGIPVTAETCAGDYQAKEPVIPEYDESKPVGTATVNVDGLNSRRFPDEQSEKLEKAESGQTYDVFEIYQDEKYTWYRIGEQRWIASEGSWVTFSE